MNQSAPAWSDVTKRGGQFHMETSQSRVEIKNRLSDGNAVLLFQKEAGPQRHRLAIRAAFLTAIFGLPLAQWAIYGWSHDVQSYLVLIPFISVYLIWLDRDHLPFQAGGKRASTFILAGLGASFLAAYLAVLLGGLHDLKEDAAEVRALILTNTKAAAIHQRILDANSFSASAEGAAWLESLPDRVLPQRAAPQTIRWTTTSSTTCASSARRFWTDASALARKLLALEISSSMDSLDRDANAMRSIASAALAVSTRRRASRPRSALASFIPSIEVLS